MYSAAMTVAIFQKTPAKGRLHKGKIPMQEIRVKRGGGCLLEGGIFLRTYSIYIHENMVCIYVVHINRAFYGS